MFPRLKQTIQLAVFSLTVSTASVAIAAERPGPYYPQAAPVIYPEPENIKPNPIAKTLERTLPEKLKPEDDTYFTFTLENDVFANTDQGYTNGGRFAILFAENDLPPLARLTLDKFPLLSARGTKRFGAAIGQSMFTPNDITVRELLENDRPYAGWLYTEFGINSDQGDRLDQLILTLGVVGPASLAEQTQEIVHGVLNADDPNGWDNQLENEPGIMLTYNRAWKAGLIFDDFLGFGMDFSPKAGFALGNVFTHASLGGTFRIGFDLPQDYGPPLISPAQAGSDFFVPRNTFGWYLFAALEGRAVVQNIFLDGNTFTGSHSVDKRPFVGDAQVGIAGAYRALRIAYTQVYRSEEFYDQSYDTVYGALTATYRF